MQTLYGGVTLGATGPDMDNVERLDIHYLPLVHYMMRCGLQVDLDHFHKMEKVLTDDMDATTEEVRDKTGYYLNLGSGDQVADLLFKKLGLKQAKRKMTASGKRESVEDDILTAIQHEHPAVALIQNYKEYEKLKGTYAIPMAKLAKHVKFTEWRMFPNLKTTRVPSGRLSCDEPNLLAMPNRTERGRELCEGFITKPGWCFLSCDFSQIEPRIGAHRSGDEKLVAIYENGEDIYSDFAIRAFKLLDKRFRHKPGQCPDPDECRENWHYPGVDKKKHRFPSKTCILSAIYEVSGPGLLEKMPVMCKTCQLPSTKHNCKRFVPQWNENNCQDIINKFGMEYDGLIAMRRKDHSTARKWAYIWDDFGRILHVAAVRSVHPWVVSAALREAGNLPLQGTARGIIKLGETQVFDDFQEMGVLGDILNPVLDVHDELVLEIREDMAEEIGSHIVTRFESVARLKVPIKASVAKAPVWGRISK